MANDLRLQVLLNAIDKASAPLRQISKGSLETARALKDARDRLKELNTQQNDISAWRSQRAAAQETSQALEAAQAKVKGLSQQFAATGVPTKVMAREFRTAVREAQALKQAHQQQSEKLQGLRSRLQEAGISTKALNGHERQLREQISATTASINTQNQRLAALNARQSQAAKLRSNFAKNREMVGVTANAGASAVATGAAAGLPILAMVKNYASFEDAMAGVAKQVDGARDDNGKLTQTYYDMGAAIKKMGESIPMATTDIAALVEGGARMGIQGKDNLLEFARVAATAATAFELPADQVGESLARIAQLFKLPIQNVSQLGDAINYLDDNAMSKGSDIIEVMQRTAGITASVGMSFKDAAALGSTFLTLGASAEVAGTATNAMIRELAIATQQPKRFQKGLAAIGLEAKAVQEGMAKDATGTIQKVLQAINKLPKTKQLGVTTELFGKEYGDDAAKLASNIGEYRRQLDLVNSTKGSGSMQREGDIKGQQLSARWQMTQNRLFNLSSALGETLRPTIIELVDGFNRIIERVNTWASQNPTLVAGLLKVAAGIAALSAGFGVVALGIAGALGPFLAVRFALSMVGLKIPTLLGLLKVLVTSLGGGLLTAIRAVSIALWGLATNPVALAIAAVIATLAGAGYLIYQNWDQVKAYFANAWTEIQTGFSSGIGGIITTLVNFSPIGLIYQAFAGVLSYLGVDLPTRFTEFGNMIVNGLVNGLLAGAGQIKDAITSIGGSTIDWFKEKLGIHSPSRVFAELGGFTMAGLTQGLQSGEQGPLDAVAQISKQLTSAGSFVMNAIAGPSPTGEQRTPAQAVGVEQPIKAAQTAAAAQPVKAAQAAGVAPQLNVVRTTVPTAGPSGADTGVLATLANLGKQITAAGALALGSIAAPVMAMGTAVTPAIEIDSRAPVAPQPAATYDSHDHYEIHIHAAPGMDAQAIARAVRAELARSDREKSARKRSQLSDQE